MQNEIGQSRAQQPEGSDGGRARLRWPQPRNTGRKVERLFQINGDLDLFGEDAEGYSLRDMARKIIPKNLKPSAKLKYIDKGGKELQDKQDILDMMETITEVLEVEHDISRERNNRDKSNHSNIPGRNPD